MSLETELFAEKLPHSPTTKTGLGQDGEKLWFARLDYARYQAKRGTDAHKRKWAAIVQHCKNFIISANEGLIKKVSLEQAARSSRYNRQVVADDIEVELWETMLNVVDNFDIKRGIRFSTYAMTSFFKRTSRTLGRDYKFHNNVKTFQSAERRELTVPDTQQAERGEIAQQLELLAVAKERAGLSNAEINVLDMRFRLEMTLEETGKVMSRTKERVRQIQVSAITKIKESMALVMEKQS
jgi:RNA polymerase sigma factor (sigma-70 family)